MNNEINFDVEVLTSEIMQKLSVPILARKNIKPKKTMAQISESRLVTNVKLSDLIIDLSYQRKPNAEKVAKIIRDFDPNAIGVIICSMRENGVVAVIDGGHRVSALNAMGMGDTDVRCLVFFGLTLKQEAEMFTTLNDNRTKPKTGDLFKSKVVAKDATAVSINKILIKHGLTISNGPAMDSIRAVGTITNIHKSFGADVLDKTIACLSNAFGKHSTSYSDQALLAIASVIHTYHNDIDIKRVVDILKSYGHVNLWSNKGTSVAKQANFSKMYIGMIFVFVGDYNKRLKKNRIDFKTIIGD